MTNGIPYFYVVSAYNMGGSSPTSDEAMAEPFVSPAAPTVTPNYGYSSDGMRAWKTVGGSTTYFLYDGSQPVCELDGTGAVTATNTWGGSLLSRRVATVSTFYTFYTFDPSGNVAQRLDASANVLGTYAFDAFGLRTGTDSTTDPYAGFEGGWGYYADAETGLSLLGHRYYDTGTGRFVNRDPIGYAGGADLYAYVDNNPVNMADPNGTQAQLAIPAAQAAWLAALAAGAVLAKWFHDHPIGPIYFHPLPPIVAAPPVPAMAVPIPGVTKPPVPVPGDHSNGWKWNRNPNYPGKGRPGKWGPTNPIPGRGGGQPGASWDPQASGKGIPHWDIDDGLGNRERCDESGNPLTDKEAHGQ